MNSNQFLSINSPNHAFSLPNSSQASTTNRTTTNKLPMYPTKYSLFKNNAQQDPLKQILGPQNFSITSNSPSRMLNNSLKQSPNTNYTSRSQPSSKKQSHRSSKSYIVDKENEDEKSLTFTVRAAHELQVEKEKVFHEEKSKLEKDIGLQKHYIGELEKHIRVYKENISKQQENIAQILCSLDVAINKDERKNQLISYNLSYDVNNWNEGIKGLSLTSKNLRGNLLKAIEGIKYSNEKSRLSGKLREGEKNMNGMIDQISTLAYKLSDAEEKLRQMIEIKNMTQEDIHSHVVTMTESIFMQEEASDVIEMLECRDAQTFEYAKKDIALNKRLLELEGDLEQQRRNLESEISDLKEKDQGIGIIKQRMNENFDEMDGLAEKLQLLENQMCAPERNLSLALRARLENAGINPMELEDLIEFFEVFEMEGEGEERGHMRMYQKEIFEEIIYVIGQTQLIENMEMNMIPKTRKSIRHERRNSQMTTAGGENSDELVNKRLEFTEKLIYYKTRRNEYEEKLTMINPKRLSFNELMKESLEGADYNVKRIVEGVILEIVGQNYSAWHTYSLIKEDLVTIQNEIMEMEDNLEMLSGKVRSNEESLRNRKKEVANKAKEIEMIRGELGKLEQSQGEIDRFEEEEDSFYGQGYTEQLLERLEVQTRRGHSLVKLKNNFTKLKNKPKDWKKMKDEIMQAEEMIARMEEYHGKTTYKIENELAPGVKKVKGQIVEYKMKVNLVQRELLLAFEQLGGVLRELENELYGRYKDEEGVIYDICNQIIVCKGYLNDLMKELKAQIIHGLTKNQLTFLEINELKRIKETTEKDSRRIHEEDIKYIFIMEGCLESLKIKLNKMKEKLGNCETEIEKYRNFYEISHELLKDKVQAGKESNRNLSMSLLSVPRDNTNSKPASPTPIPNLVLNPRDLNVFVGETEKNITKFETNSQETEKPIVEQAFQIEGDFSSPKMYQGEVNWLKGVEVPTLDSSSTTKTQSSNSVNFTSVRSPVSIEKRLLPHDMSTKNLRPHPQEKGTKNLYVDEEEMKSLMGKFEKGFNVLKRFSDNNKVEEKVSVTLSMKGKSKPKRDLKGYGKRILKLNIKEKSIDVLKVGVMGTRNVVEYKYGWESLKQVVIGSKTMQEIRERQRDREYTKDLEIIKEVQGQENLGEDQGDEEKEMLNVAIDVINKGRIDFLMNDVEQVLALWNFVHVKLKN